MSYNVESEDDSNWVKCCMTLEAEELDRGRQKKTWWDSVKDNMDSLGLSQKDAQFRNKWRRIKGATGNKFIWKNGC